MPKKFAVSIVLTVLTLPAMAKSQMHMGPQMPEPANITVPEAGATVPMLDMGGRPVVEVKINGKGPYRFIFDTGAVTTVISDDLSHELSLSAPTGVMVASGTGEAPPPIVSVREIRVGDAVLEGLIAAAMPLGGLLKGEDAPRGVLSAASFPGYLVTYDFPGKQVSIKKGALGNADSQSCFQYNEDEVLPTVPLRIAGHATRVHLDTGSGFGLILPMKFLAELPLASPPKKEDQKFHTHGGEFSVSNARVNGPIELGKYKLDLDQVQFSDVNPGIGPPSGNIGYEVLRRFVVVLDSRNRRIRLDQ